MSLYERQNADTAGSGSRFYDLHQTVVRLSSLDKFRRVGQDRYVACCPAHDDKNPSLSITQTPDKVLVHCFAGCSQQTVLSKLTDLQIWNHAYSENPSLQDRFTEDQLERCLFYVLVWNAEVRKGDIPSGEETKTKEKCLRILARHSISKYESAMRDLYGM